VDPRSGRGGCTRSEESCSSGRREKGAWSLRGAR
jgi:hypothetical protein